MNIFFKRFLLLSIVLMLASGSVFAGGGGGSSSGGGSSGGCGNCSDCVKGTRTVTKGCDTGCNGHSYLNDWYEYSITIQTEYDYSSNCCTVEETKSRSYRDRSVDCGCTNSELGFSEETEYKFDTCN